MRRTIATILCTAMITTGCASAGGPRLGAAAPQSALVDTGAMADYVQRITVGSRVRVDRTDGAQLRGTLMKATPDGIVVQKNTRVAEPPISVPMPQIARVTVDHGGGTSVGKAVGIGIASGVGAFFTILAFAFAVSD